MYHAILHLNHVAIYCLSGTLTINMHLSVVLRWISGGGYTTNTQPGIDTHLSAVLGCNGTLVLKHSIWKVLFWTYE